MASTEIKGKVVKVPQPAYVLYNGFADLRNFTMALPPDKKESVIATADTIEGEVQGVKMGLQVAKRYPFSCISYSQYGNTPFSFNVAAFFNAIDSTNTEFHIEYEAELPFMIKMMIGSKLQEMIDQITEQLGMAFSGQFDPSKVDPQMLEELKKRYNINL